MHAFLTRPTPTCASYRSVKACSRPAFVASYHLPVRSSKRASITTHCAAKEYAVQVAACEQSGDWATTLELLAEVKVLKVELPPAVMESTVRTLASGGQWQRAVTSLLVLMEKEHRPQTETVTAVFQALSVAKEGGKAFELLEAISVRTDPSERSSLSPLYDTTVRTLARGGEVDMACDLLDKALASAGDILLFSETYTVLAMELMKAGKHHQAELVLEYRDYL